MHYILSIDQGTTSTRAIIFDECAQRVALAQYEITQAYPQNAWVEHNPAEIWQSTLNCIDDVLAKANLNLHDVNAIGIANQRETTIVWDRQSGETIYPAIVWQDRRTSQYCEHLKEDATINQIIQQKTGLLLDPYFSATKVSWILDNVPKARERAERGELAFGTVDSFLLWRLTDGAVHATEATNASRTMLYNIHTGCWDDDLLKLFGIPRSILPEVKDTAGIFGYTHPKVLGAEVIISGVAGDQQAAAVGQACFQPGMIKATYGTGCFMLLNTGEDAVVSQHRLLTTIAYQLNGAPTYALEGSIFVAGAALTWLRDTLRFFDQHTQTHDIASSVDDNAGVYLVPAFTGLGAPYWDPDARGALLGLTRDTQIEHIVRAALEAVCYQSRDLLEAMEKDSRLQFTTLKVDGGMTANDWVLQFLADMVNMKVERPTCIESSALGAAFLAGLGAKIWPDFDAIKNLLSLGATFYADMPASLRDKYYRGWQHAVRKIIAS